MTEVRLSEEQELLAATVADMAARSVAAPPAPGGAVPPDPAAWSALVDSGLVGLRLPEAHGGSGGGAVEVALVVEQLARGPVAVPYLGTALAVALAAAAGPEGLALAAELAAGRHAGVVVGLDLRGPAAEGVAVDAGPGEPALGTADGRVVVVEDGRALDGVDLCRRLRVAEGPGRTLGAIEPPARTAWLAYALALVCADLLGAMEGALDAAVEHARHREQFGRPIGSFQAVQHLCADQLVTIEAARSACWHAAWAADALDPGDALAAARVAKAWCSEAARDVTEAAVQVWGGIGMTWECPAHLHLRRALLSRRLLGDETHHLEALADELLAPEAAG